MLISDTHRIAQSSSRLVSLQRFFIYIHVYIAESVCRQSRSTQIKKRSQQQDNQSESVLTGQTEGPLFYNFDARDNVQSRGERLKAAKREEDTTSTVPLWEAYGLGWMRSHVKSLERSYAVLECGALQEIGPHGADHREQNKGQWHNLSSLSLFNSTWVLFYKRHNSVF